MDQNRHGDGWQTLQRTKINIVRIGKQYKKSKINIACWQKIQQTKIAMVKKRDLQKYFLEIAICINMINKSWHRMQCSTHQRAKVDIALVDVNFFPLPISIVRSY
jgi:hypothetical protein